MPRAYISADEFPLPLDSALQPTLPELTVAIERATMAVDSALVGVWYETGPDHLPTDADLLDAIRTATLYQTEAIVDDLLIASGAKPPRIRTASIGSASYTLDSTAGTARTLPADGSLCPDARTVLRVAGLLNVDPYVTG